MGGDHFTVRTVSSHDGAKLTACYLREKLHLNLVRYTKVNSKRIRTCKTMKLLKKKQKNSQALSLGEEPLSMAPTPYSIKGKKINKLDSIKIQAFSLEKRCLRG